jgi:hypothetical protein
MLVNLNVLRARAEDVPKARAHHATLTSFPADTHASFLVFFDIKMTFVVTVLADRDALQTRRTAFMVYLTPECFFSGSAWCICGDIGELFCIVDAPSDLSPGSCKMYLIVQLVFMRAREEVQMAEEVVWVQGVACGHGPSVG